MALRRLVDQARPRLVVVDPLRRRFLPGWCEAVPRAARWQNGWGFVLLMDGHVFYDYGVIRPEHLAPFAARKALEIVAQVLPLVTFARRLSPYWIAFMDNVAGQFALMKGCGATGKTQRHPRFVLGPGGRQAVSARLP